MNLFEPTHLLILAAIALLFFGGKKIPELMRGVGQGVGELQKGLEESKRAISSITQDTKQAMTSSVKEPEENSEAKASTETIPVETSKK